MPLGDEPYTNWPKLGSPFASGAFESYVYVPVMTSPGAKSKHRMPSGFWATVTVEVNATVVSPAAVATPGAARSKPIPRQIPTVERMNDVMVPSNHFAGHRETASG